MEKIIRMEYEAKKRLEWFISGYYIHNLGSLFSKIPTERICEIYNVDIEFFRPKNQEKKSTKPITLN